MRQNRRLLHVALLAMPLVTEAFVPPSPYRSSALPLHQALEMRDPENPRRGWRRAVSKVLRREGKSRTDSVFQVSQKDDSPIKASTVMQYSSHSDMVAEMDVDVNTNLATILHDFELLTPSDVFPNLTIDEIAAPYMGTLNDLDLFLDDHDNDLIPDDVDDDELSLGLEEVTQPTIKVDRATVMNRMSKSWFESMIHGLVHRRSIEPPQGLTVSADPEGVSNMLRGQVRTDAKISFRKIVTGPIQLSGGSVQAKRLVMNLRSFAPDLLRQGARRFPAQFDFLFNDCVFTEEDLIQSRSIRNGLGRLLARVLTRAGVSSNHVTIKSIRLLRNGKVACAGEAGTTFGGLIPFEVRSGLSLASRGHVLTLPGLEVSLQPSLGLFVPVLPEIDLDIGHNARLKSVDISGNKLEISAKVTVTPEHTLKLKEYLQTKESYSAHFSFDVGRWLTKAGNFTL
eukprot:CAMPEP_0119006018 /NCGR_PEP_ID=MMETSP1176-20130426/2065_1 /TAXON_ID=265551 /ORGANISM="Synedropsis recta cf, Strain CCMP1620" /LENGTH=453 /DNA_ID=CAMNT_0006957901 /DNA_START=174 /DNA_END=1535 /DNA_ORIENTATION=-